MICLYVNGVELTREELAATPRYDGDLVLEDWGNVENIFRHNIRKARFLDHKAARDTKLLPPLFDPVVVKMTADHMMLRGYQIRRIDEQAVHTAQCWLLKHWTSEQGEALK